MDLAQAWPGENVEATPLWPSSHHPTFHSPGGTATVCRKVQLCRGAGQESTFSELGCPCVHLVNREQPDLSVTVIGLVFWACPPPSCQKKLYRNVPRPRPQFGCGRRPEQRKFPVRSLITLNTRLLPAALSPSCNHFCSSRSAEVTLGAAVPSAEAWAQTHGAWGLGQEALRGVLTQQVSPYPEGTTLNSKF